MGRVRAVAKVAKAVGGKVRLQRGLDEDAEEGEEGDEAREEARLWGANKRAYHGADDEVGGAEDTGSRCPALTPRRGKATRSPARRTHRLRIFGQQSIGSLGLSGLAASRAARRTVWEGLRAGRGGEGAGVPLCQHLLVSKCNMMDNFERGRQRIESKNVLCRAWRAE